MEKKAFFLMFIMFAVVLLGGCRTSPILNINNETIAINGKYTLKDVEKAIIRAGASLGWEMHPKEPGRVIGVLHLRDHMAKIDILYDKSKYSIHYLDSKNLKYDGHNIHSNYNGWIQRLNQNIQVQLSTM